MEELQKALAYSFNASCRVPTNDLPEWEINHNVSEDQKIIFGKYILSPVFSNHKITKDQLDRALFTAISNAIIIYKDNPTGKFSLNEFVQIFSLTSGMSPDNLKKYILFWRGYLLHLSGILVGNQEVSNIYDSDIRRLLNGDVRDIIRNEIIQTELTLRDVTR